VVLSGIGGVIFSLFIMYIYATVPAIGMANPASLGVVFAVYIITIVYYYAIKLYRKSRQGIDIDLAFREVPPE